MAGADPLANPEPLLRRVYAYVAYRVADRSEAEDITSETFERALRYRDRYDPRKGEPVAWLLGIARNCIYDAQLRPRPAGGDPAGTATAGHEDEVVDRVALHEALAELNNDDRELLALRYGADLRTREIAKLLEQRPNTVDVALSRARARLADALERGPRQPGVGSLSADLADRTL